MTTRAFLVFCLLAGCSKPPVCEPDAGITIRAAARVPQDGGPLKHIEPNGVCVCRGAVVACGPEYEACR